MMIDPQEAVPSTMLALRAGSASFYDLRHQRVYNAILGAMEDQNGVDIITVTEHLRAAGHLDEVGGMGFLNELVDGTPSSANLPYYLEVVVDKYAMRQILATCASAMAAASDPKQTSDVAIGQLRDDIIALENGVVATPTPSSMIEVMDRTEAYVRSMRSGTLRVPTGFRGLDMSTYGGFEPGEFWVIAARTNLGKTALALNIAQRRASMLHNVGSQRRVLFFSVEMPLEQMGVRLWATMSNVRPDSLRPPTLMEATAMESARERVRSLPLLIDDRSNLTVRQVLATARQAHRRHGLDLVIVDYLQLIENEPGIRVSDRRLQVDQISRALKNGFKDLRIPLLAVVQINREGDDPNTPPRISQIRESGQIEQDADFIFMLWEKDKHAEGDLPEVRNVKLRVGKSRRGQKDFDIDLTFRGGVYRFDDANRPTLADIPTTGQNQGG